MSAGVESRLDALERAVADLEAWKANPTIQLDGDRIAAALKSRVRFAESSDETFQSLDGLERVADGLVGGDQVGLGGEGTVEVSSDDERFREVGGGAEHVRRQVVVGHGDSSAVGPDAATSGDDTTVGDEGGASAVDGDSSGGRVTGSGGGES